MKLLGIEFHPMTDSDYEAFGGAPDGCFTAESGEVILIFDPSEATLTEINAETAVERDWKMNKEWKLSSMIADEIRHMNS